ncbi:MAG: hypothetical protein IJ193_02560 [Bacilli bacterium]|nr:hypothetical protein [Bacilli bacterium]
MIEDREEKSVISITNKEKISLQELFEDNTYDFEPTGFEWEGSVGKEIL